MTRRSLRLDSQGRLEAPALWESEPLQRLLAVFNTEGEEARIIGGAVRNALIGLPVADVDIATTAVPEDVMVSAKAAGFRAIPTGLAHGTVTVLVEGQPFEVTTLRRDVETDGRHAVVAFSRTFAEDAERRDFTINALSVSTDRHVHDTVGGLPDLAAGRVRFIGEADRRIREDYLRILRFFRFHAAYGDGALDPEGLAAAIRQRDALARLSRERIRTEMLKLLVADGAFAVLDVMESVGILPLTLGTSGNVDRLRRLVDVERRAGLAPDPHLRLAALAVRSEQDALHLRETLRLSNDETNRLIQASAAAADLAPAAVPDRQGCLTLLYAHGSRAAHDGVLLTAAEAALADRPAWMVAYGVITGEAVPVLPIGGADVMARGIAGGRHVGAVLKAFQARWIRAGFPRDPATLASLLDRSLEEAAWTP